MPACNFNLDFNAKSIYHLLLCQFFSKQPFLRCLARSLAETPGKIVNQFPSENVLTNKDLLAEVAMRSVKLDDRKATDDEICHRGPMWLPTTFNLSTELPNLIKHFKEREARFVQTDSL